MASDRLVRYIVTVDSTGALAGMERLSRATEASANRMQAAGSRMKSMGAGMIGMGRSLSYVSLPLAALGGYAIKSSIDFEKSMTLIRTQAGASAKEVAYFSKALVGMGHTGFDAKELSQALYFVRSDAFEGKQALDVLAAAAHGAAISGASLSETAYGLTSVLRTGLKDVHGAGDAMNKLDSIVGLGKLKWEELNVALSTGFLGTVQQVHLGLADIGTAFDAFARRGYPPQVAATNFRKALIQMAAVAGSGVSKKAMASIGISAYQLANDLKHPHGLIYALQDLHDHLKRVSEVKGTALLAEAFGRSKGAGTIFQLLESLPEQRKIEREKEKYGTIQEKLAQTEKTNAFKIKEAMALLKNGLIELGSSLAPVVIPFFLKLAEALKDVAKWFKDLPTPIKEVGTYLGIAAVLGGPLLIFFGHIAKSIGALMLLFGGLGPGAAAGATAMAGEGAAFGAAGAAMGGAWMAAFRKALGPIAWAVFLAEGIKFLGTHKVPKGFGGSGGSEGRSWLDEAGSAMPWGGKGVISEAGHTPRSEHERELQQLIRQPHGFMSPAHEAALARDRARLEAKIRAETPRAPEHIHIKTDIHLNDRHLAEALSTHIRDNPAGLAAKHLSEGVLRKSHINNARSANP